MPPTHAKALKRQRQMRLRQIVLRLHFHQPADGAHEFVGEIAFGIEFFHRHGAGDAHFDAVVVKHVHQQRETAGFVFFVGRHFFKAGNQHGVAVLRQPQIVGLRARAKAQGAEIKPGDALGAFFRRQLAAVDFQFFRLLFFAAGKAFKQGGQFGFVFGVVRHVKHFGGRERAHAVIFAAVNVEHGEFLFQEGDGGQKAAAVLPLRVEFGRGVVGCGHQHHAFGKQVFQQAAEYHGIGDVADVEFVKTEYAQLDGDVLGDGFERVRRIAFFAHALVDFLHKGVKVDAAFAPVRQAAVESVHQETFAAADAAVEIQAGGHLRRAQAAAEKAVALALEHHQFRPQPVEIFDGAHLGGIADKAGLLGGGLIPGERAVIVKRRRNKTGLCHRIFRLRGGRNSAPRGGYGLENRAAR